MSYLLSYASGVIGYGLSDDLDEAMKEAEERCDATSAYSANIVERGTYRVVATVAWRPEGYIARKVA